MTDQNLKYLCKTLWDIAAQSQKLDALKTHKKGLMQQLFPATGARQASPLRGV